MPASAAGAVETPLGFSGPTGFNGTACYGEVCTFLPSMVKASVFAPGESNFRVFLTRISK